MSALPQSTDTSAIFARVDAFTNTGREDEQGAPDGEETPGNGAADHHDDASRTVLHDRLQIAVPDAVRPLPGWLLWRAEPDPERPGKVNKVPYYVSGHKRNGTQGAPADRREMATFDEACAKLVTGSWGGIGLALFPEFRIVAGDFDANGKPLHPKAAELAQGTYAERSPSGQGIRCLWRGSWPAAKSANHEAGIEIFHGNGYVTITGDLIHDEPVADLPEATKNQLLELISDRQVGAANSGAGTVLVPADTVRDLRSALNAIPSDDRDTWVNVAYALHELGDVGRELWFTWSMTSDKYDPVEAGRVWNSIKSPIAHYQAVFDRAQKHHGWINPLAGRAAPPIFDETPLAPRYPRPRDFWAPTPESAMPDLGGALPAPLASLVHTIAEARGHDPGMIAGALLAALSACIAQATRIAPYDGGTWREGSVLWVGLIGESGRGKTPSMTLATAPLDELERDAIAARKGEGGTTLIEDAGLPERLLARDTTLEALTAAHQRTAHRLLVVKDEGTAWLNGMGQYNGKAEAERGAWCSAWNCAPYHVDRITRKALRFEDWGAALLVGITPRQMKEAAEDARSDGLLARVLPVLVRAPLPALPSPQEGDAEARLRLLARTLHALPAIATTLAREARDLWTAEATKARELADHFERTNPALASWLRKFAANALRIALLFALVNIATNAPGWADGLRRTLTVGVDEMRRALALMGWFAQAATLFFEEAAPDPARELAKECALLIAYRLHRNPEAHPRIARRDFERHSLRAWARADEQTREAAVLALHDGAWLLGADGRSAIGPRLGQATAWTVNPVVGDVFATMAQTEAQRRRAVRDRLAGLGQPEASENA